MGTRPGKNKRISGKSSRQEIENHYLDYFSNNPNRKSLEIAERTKVAIVVWDIRAIINDGNLEEDYLKQKKLLEEFEKEFKTKGGKKYRRYIFDSLLQMLKPALDANGNSLAK